MFKGLSGYYTPLPTSSFPEDEPEKPAQDAGRRKPVEIVLCGLIVLVSIIGLWQINGLVQRLDEHGPPSLTPAHPDFAPVGTIGGGFETTSQAVQDQAGLATLNLSGLETSSLAFNGPTVVSVLQRSQPTKVFYNASATVQEALLSDDYAVILQFNLPTRPNRLCAIALAPAVNDEIALTMRAQHLAQVWNVSHTAPLDPSNISYTHRPPRHHYLGDVEFGLDRLSSTNAFPCPMRDTLTVQLQCRELALCNIRWMQAIEGSTGVQLVRWDAE